MEKNLLTKVLFILVFPLPKVMTKIRLSFVYCLSWTRLVKMRTLDS